MKPYEKFVCYGAKALSDAELLALIIRTGTKNRDAMTLAEDVLHLCGAKGLVGLHHLQLEDYMSVSGIGEVKAIKLQCIGELSNRISKASVTYANTFQNPEAVASYYMEEMRHSESEQCRALFLDNKCHLLADKMLSYGTIRETLMPRRELFKEALKANASQMILIHNHPSGDPTPSQEDIQATKQIILACRLMEIPLSDHIIIGDKKYVSLKQLGLLDS